MKSSNLELDWIYYLRAILIMIAGVGALYINSTIYKWDYLDKIGIVLLLIGTVAVIGKNISYMFEGTDPKNLVKYSAKP